MESVYSIGKKVSGRILLYVFIVAICFFSFACTPETYHGDQLENSIRHILKKEYDITDVRIKIVGKTLGVYLPLQKIFSANFDTFSDTSDKKSLEDLLKFNEEAMDRIEDVLFTTSRVILSTDRPIDFYVIKAVESESTGIELVLTGNVLDMKRVRFWDIPLSEYRKRVLHDLTINRTVIWKKTVREFFNAIGNTPISDLLKKYFPRGITLKDISPFFYSQLLEAEYKKDLTYEILSTKTKPINETQVLVYMKVREDYVPREGYEQYRYLFNAGDVHEYLIVLESHLITYRINQVIPFYYIDEENVMHRLEFPDELKIYDNIDTWTDEFELEEVFMGDFVARQMTKRIQALIVQDELLAQYFSAQKIECVYQNSPDEDAEVAEAEFPYFSVQYEPHADDTFLFNALEESVPMNIDKEMTPEKRIYFYEILLREFSQVIHSYKFKEYNFIEFFDQETAETIRFAPDRVEGLRQKTLTIDQLVAQAT